MIEYMTTECIVYILLRMYFKNAHLDFVVCSSLLSKPDYVARINHKQTAYVYYNHIFM